MARRTLPVTLLIVGLLAACRVAGPAPTPAALSTASPPAPAAIPTPYPFTAVRFKRLRPYPTPAGDLRGLGAERTQALPPGAMTPQPAEGRSADSSCPFVLVAQTKVGRYTIRRWELSCSGWGVATISVGKQVLAQSGGYYMGVHVGRDITGEGHPDVVVNTGDSGSYSHMATKVYDLGPTLTQVLDTPVVSADPSYYLPCPFGGVFSDLDGNGSAEFITCDDAASMEYYSAGSDNPFAENRVWPLSVMAVLAYEPGRGYVPAGPRFADLYAGNLDMYTRMA